MPERAELSPALASSVWLQGIVDYAGVFPPAALSLPQAIHAYAEYHTSGDAWMLGRFVCPASALSEFAALADALLPPNAGAWRLSATSSGDLAADAHHINDFNNRRGRHAEAGLAMVDSYEARVSSTGEIDALRDARPPHVVAYCEVTAAQAGELAPHVRAAGLRMKLRAGGVTANAFPPAADVVRFLRACTTHRVPAKVTAGLHHALCGVHPLTYAADAPRAPMFGFANVFLVAALLTHGGNDHDAEQLLTETDATRLRVDADRVTWHNAREPVVFDRQLLSKVRAKQLLSFGSCSFVEPVGEARALGWLESHLAVFGSAPTTTPIANRHSSTLETP